MLGHGGEDDGSRPGAVERARGAARQRGRCGERRRIENGCGRGNDSRGK
jgi:hypothetical protein